LVNRSNMRISVHNLSEYVNTMLLIG